MAEEKKTSFSDIVKNLSNIATNSIGVVTSVMSGNILAGIQNISAIGDTLKSMPTDPNYVPPTQDSSPFGLSIPEYEKTLNAFNDTVNNVNALKDNFNLNSVNNTVLDFNNAITSVIANNNDTVKNVNNSSSLKNSKGAEVGNNRVARGLADNNYTLHTDTLIASKYKNPEIVDEILDVLPTKSKYEFKQDESINDFFSAKINYSGVADSK